MSDSTAYHLAELEIVRRKGDPHRCVPQVECAGLDVLDVGCGIGQTLMAPEFLQARSRHGIDVDAQAVSTGQKMFPELALVVGSAERLPYGDASFALVFSRVALPYTNVPVAITEMLRVAKPGGIVWLALHSWKMEGEALLEAIRKLQPRRMIDLTYIAANSIFLATAGRCFARPWSGSYESVQSAAAMKRLMSKLSFREIRMSREGHLCISGRK